MDHELVDLQPAYAGAPDCESTDSYRTDRQSPERGSPHGHRTQGVCRQQAPHGHDYFAISSRSTSGRMPPLWR